VILKIEKKKTRLSISLSASPNIDHNNQYAGDVNQALIELGSTVCKVREPDCESCPLRTWCSAYQKVAGKNDGEVRILDTDYDNALFFISREILVYSRC
jgi:adenine-specific DNA glycosylase